MDPIILHLPRKGRPVEERWKVAWGAGAEISARLAPETPEDDAAAAKVFRLTGSYRFETDLECARCLAPVRLQVEDHFETRLDLARNVSEAMDLAAGEEPATFARLPEDRLDLTQEIETRLAQAVPDLVLCSPSCQGLCPTCGANRNEPGACACDAKPKGN